MDDDGIMNVNLVSFRSSYYQSNIEKSLHHPLEDIFYVSSRFLWHKKPLFLESISAKCSISAYFTVIGLFAKHTFSESGRSCVLSSGFSIPICKRLFESSTQSCFHCSEMCIRTFVQYLGKLRWLGTWELRIAIYEIHTWK